jgi:microsomal dipeptidase-like Zn-dependent dipeptidase
MPNPDFTDIHCHPELKTFLSADVEVQRLNCWQSPILPVLLKAIDRILLGNILESQYSLNQLRTFNGTIFLAGLYSLEKAMVNGDLINLLGTNVDLVKVAGLLQLLGYPGIIDDTLTERISLPQTSYFQVFNEVQTHLLKSSTINPGYNLMKKIEDYDPNSLNLILCIEGGHNLLSNAPGINLRNDVLANLGVLKASDHHYLYMSLTHVECNPLCTHAYAIQFLHHKDFMPSGHGITPLGIDVIAEALKRPNRILIDIKHMSLESRKQYYSLLQRDYRLQHIPILISHGGVTGVSWDNKPVVCWKKSDGCIKVRYFRPKGAMKTRFNPWSINLYDEEIKIIVESDGLIGLNLDERILGAKQKRQGKRIEYFSPEEFNRHNFKKQLLKSIFAWEPFEILTEEEPETRELEIRLLEYLRNIITDYPHINNYQEMLNEIDRLYHRLQAPVLTEKGVKHLCNNILHIIKVAGDDGWKHISIGSDFDGLINPVDSCKNATQYKMLSDKLESILPDMALTIPGIPAIADIQQKVFDIMSGNAFRFLRRYF